MVNRTNVHQRVRPLHIRLSVGVVHSTLAQVHRFAADRQRPLTSVSIAADQLFYGIWRHRNPFGQFHPLRHLQFDGRHGRLLQLYNMTFAGLFRMP